MNFFRIRSVKQRVGLVVVLVLLPVFAILLGVLLHSSKEQANQSLKSNAQIYLNQLEVIIGEAERAESHLSGHTAYQSLKPYFNHAAFFDTDYPFLIGDDGSYAIHFFKQGQQFPMDRLTQMFAQREGSLEYAQKDRGKEQHIRLFFKRLDNGNRFVALPVNLGEANRSLQKETVILITLFVGLGLLFLLLIQLLLKPISTGISKANRNILNLSHGEPLLETGYGYDDELRTLNLSITRLEDTQKGWSAFAKKISQNSFHEQFRLHGPNDELGKSLLKIQHNLKESMVQEQNRREEDEKRSWVTLGMVRFSDILRKDNHDLHKLASNVLGDLLNYMGAAQGALFLSQQEGDKVMLRLLSAYAQSKKKVRHMSIPLGEGLVGGCALEKETLYIREIPEKYFDITSGLGEARPTALLLVPLKIEGAVLGVLEIATFKEFQEHEIEFVEKVGESIASALFSVKSSIRTAELLEQAQQQSEELLAQDEEMRQNMEEMQATQEEMERKTIELEQLKTVIDVGMLYMELSPGGDILTANKNMLNLLALPIGEVEGRTFSDFVLTQSPAQYNSLWEKLQNGESYSGSLAWNTGEGSEHILRGIITPLFGSAYDMQKLIFLGQDITVVTKNFNNA